MEKNTNIENIFRKAFENAEAPFEPSELEMDWQSVSQNIPSPTPNQAPNPQSGGDISQSIWQQLAQKGFTATKFLVGGVSLSALVVASVLWLNNPEPNQPTQVTKPIHNTPEGSLEGSSTFENNIESQPQTLNNTLTDETQIQNQQVEGNGFIKSKNKVNITTTPQSKTGIGINNNPKYSLSNTNATQISGKDIKQQTTAQSANNYSEGIIYLMDTSICSADFITIYIQSATVINWGDGTKQEVINPNNYSHNYSKSGIYTLEYGKIKRSVVVLESPKASFIKQSNNKGLVTYKSTSKNATKLVWSFGDGIVQESNFDIIRHTYNQDGIYSVYMIAQSPQGCKDSQVMNVKVLLNQNIAPIPNVFTPNGDGVNDVFGIEISGEEWYELEIFSASGQKVFSSKEKSIKWNGLLNNSGNASLQGNYFYILKYKFPDEQEKIEKGAIYLQRN